MNRPLGPALAALLALPFAACGKAPESEDRTVIRYLACPDVGSAHLENIARFEKLHPGIKVEMVEGPPTTDTREDMYAMSFMGGESTYDMVFADVIWVPRFADQGWLRPLDEWFTPEMQEEFLAGDIAGSRYEGRIYRVPTETAAGMLYYRKDLLQKHGLKPPKTWDDLVAAAKKTQKPPELWGFVFQGDRYEGLVCDFFELVWSNGGSVIDAQGKVRVDGPRAVEALTWLVDAVHRHGISPESALRFQEQESRRMFQEGKAVFMRNWPDAWSLLQEEGSPVKGKIGVVPMVRGKGIQRGVATLGGWGFGISALSKNPEAAWKFIRFVSAVESQKIGLLRSGIIPTRKELFEDPEVMARIPHHKMLYEVLRAARPRPVHPAYALISDALQVHLSAALSKRETPEEALKAAAKEIRSFLE